MMNVLKNPDELLDQVVQGNVSVTKANYTAPINQLLANGANASFKVPAVSNKEVMLIDNALMLLELEFTGKADMTNPVNLLPLSLYRLIQSLTVEVGSGGGFSYTLMNTYNNSAIPLYFFTEVLQRFGANDLNLLGKFYNLPLVASNLIVDIKEIAPTTQLIKTSAFNINSGSLSLTDSVMSFKLKKGKSIFYNWLVPIGLLMPLLERIHAVSDGVTITLNMSPGNTPKLFTGSDADIANIDVKLNRIMFLYTKYTFTKPVSLSVEGVTTMKVNMQQTATAGASVIEIKAGAGEFPTGNVDITVQSNNNTGQIFGTTVINNIEVNMDKAGIKNGDFITILDENTGEFVEIKADGDGDEEFLDKVKRIFGDSNDKVYFYRGLSKVWNVQSLTAETDGSATLPINNYAIFSNTHYNPNVLNYLYSYIMNQGSNIDGSSTRIAITEDLFRTYLNYGFIDMQNYTRNSQSINVTVKEKLGFNNTMLGNYKLSAPLTIKVQLYYLVKLVTTTANNPLSFNITQ